MKFWKILVLLLFVGISAFLFFSCRKIHYANFPPKLTGDWVAFGDSLTSGYGSSPGNDYPTLLSKEIGRKIINAGVPGETTENGLNRVDEIIQMQPRVVLLCFGGNDSLQRWPVEKTVANLSAIVDRLQQGGSFVVLIGIRSASVLDHNAKPFKKLAAEKRVLYVPNMLKGILGTPSLMSDQIHPSDEGYKIIAKRLEEVLLPLLPNL